MKNFRILIIAVAVIFLMTGCTHNNGDIGPYFGTWKLTGIEVDGKPDETYSGNIFWQFQSTVFCMRQVNAHHDTDIRWGSWEETADGMLVLNFTHHDDEHPVGSSLYSPLPATGLASAVNYLKIDRKSSSHLTLTYLSDGGPAYCYYLRKW